MYWKHLFGIVAASVAIIVSLGQAINAVKKSNYHKKLRDGHASNDTLKEVFADDVRHFRRVGLLWLIGVVGALATLIAEVIDAQV